MSATCERIARRLGLPPERCELLRIASELSKLTESLNALAYAALGQQGPSVRRRRSA